MRSEGHEVWAKRIERLRDSPLTDIEFAAEIGVNVNTLRSWKYKIRHGDSKRRIRKPKPRQGKPTFLEISASGLGASDLELVIAEGLRIRVPVGFDNDTLSRLLSVVGQAG